MSDPAEIKTTVGTSQRAKPGILFTLTSLVAMALLAIGSAQQAGSGLEHGQGSLMLALVCFPIGLVHLVMVFLTLFRPTGFSSWGAICFYVLEAGMLAIAMVTAFFTENSQSTVDNVKTMAAIACLLLFCLLCIYLTYDWIGRFTPNGSGGSDTSD